MSGVGRIFVSYRRADDPFGAGLVAAVLRDRFGEDAVFLDTWVLNRRADPEAGLCRGLDDSAVVLALIGRRWEARFGQPRPGPAQWWRPAPEPRDWVAWELREAAHRGLPVIPVFLRRSRVLSTGVPDELHRAFDGQGVAVRRGSLRGDAERLVALLDGRDGVPAPGPGAAPIGDDLDPGTVATAVDAMLRHVVPVPQQHMGNRKLLVDTCVTVLGSAGWLRHVSAGASPGRPSGSGIVVAGEAAVIVANLHENFAVADRACVTLGPGQDDLDRVAVQRRRRFGVRQVADLRLHRRNGTHVDVRGLFARAAEDLLDNLPDNVGRDG